MVAIRDTSRIDGGRAEPRRVEVRFTRPVRRVVVMLMFLGVVGGVVGYLSTQILGVFYTNPELNGLIIFVFVTGILGSFWQVFRLFGAVNWIEALAARARGIDNVAPPSLLVAMDPMRKTQGARGVGATTARSMLDSISTRMEESRDTLRYISGLLIFLGLLGTFWGLAQTIPAVVDTIRNLQPRPGEEGAAIFNRLITGLEDQLGGMGTAFASSLLGLAGSMAVGFLELMSAGAQNRFYDELETWLSTLTRLGTADTEADAGMFGDLAEQLAFNSQQMTTLNRIIAEGEDRRAADSAKIADALVSIERIAAQAISEREAMTEALASQTRLVAAVEQMAGSGGDEGMDVETRRHIRNIDVLLAKLIEESAAGRIETAEALRREMRAVGRAVNDLADSLTVAEPRE